MHKILHLIFLHKFIKVEAQKFTFDSFTQVYQQNCINSFLKKLQLNKSFS